MYKEAGRIDWSQDSHSNISIVVPAAKVNFVSASMEKPVGKKMGNFVNHILHHLVGLRKQGVQLSNPAGLCCKSVFPLS